MSSASVAILVFYFFTTIVSGVASYWIDGHALGLTFLLSAVIAATSFLLGSAFQWSLTS